MMRMLLQLLILLFHVLLLRIFLHRRTNLILFNFCGCLKEIHVLTQLFNCAQTILMKSLLVQVLSEHLLPCLHQFILLPSALIFCVQLSLLGKSDFLGYGSLSIHLSNMLLFMLIYCLNERVIDVFHFGVHRQFVQGQIFASQFFNNLRIVLIDHKCALIGNF